MLISKVGNTFFCHVTLYFKVVYLVCPLYSVFYHFCLRLTSLRHQMECVSCLFINRVHAARKRFVITITIARGPIRDEKYV